jgi:putative MATE family efflux protein
MGDEEEADKIASLGFFCSFIFTVVPAVIGIIFITPFMRLLGSSETILPYAKSYGFYILISGPALAMSCVLNNIMRYEGKAFYAMIGLVSGGILNMIGDPIFMFGFGMGIDGAGLSTALSQYISLAILGYMFYSGKTISKISLSKLVPDHTRFMHIIRNGFPSFIRQALNSLSSATLNNCAKPYGDPAIAAMSIVGRISLFLGSAMIGIGQGFQPVSSYNYGARKYGRIRQAFRFTLKLSETVLGILAVIFFIIPEPVISVFRDDPEVISIGSAALRFHCIAIVAQPLGVLTNMLFQSTGKSRIASFTATLRSGLYYIPSLIILPMFLGITGIECSQMVSDCLTSLTCLPFALSFFRDLPANNMEAPLDIRYQKAVKRAEKKL